MSVTRGTLGPDPAALADDRRAALDAAVRRALGSFADEATISVEELAEILGIGRTSAYQLVREGRVPALVIGKARRVLIPGLVAVLLGVEVGQ